MSKDQMRVFARSAVVNRVPRAVSKDQIQQMQQGQIFGVNTFNINTAEGIPEGVRSEILKAASEHRPILKEHGEVVAASVTRWAKSKGATHFCHWFQPLTGNTAEKHDSFLDFDKSGAPIERLTSSSLLQGEPDASSFPNGGSRSTFEARGYTSWDVSSPMFIKEGKNGTYLCIPTAFVSYHGNALDLKTPLLRSSRILSEKAIKFLQLTGDKDVESVSISAGPEQEYFLIDKDFYYGRPDLIMTGRTLLGKGTSRNQQLDDHYFGTIPDRVLAFMQEVDLELLKLGIPTKTRHNEVAPGQFEIAPIFESANVATDHNQLVMSVLESVAIKHNFVALMHEKPFAGINGSGKHINWSMQSNKGLNLLSPGKEPHSNLRFLAVISAIAEAVNRHGNSLRWAISGHGNDHRLGANEAPPSVISVYIGATLQKIFSAISLGTKYVPEAGSALNFGTDELVTLSKDNTDRNRTSPFAFTGNRFEFRAVGSSQSIGFPIAVLNAAVSEVFEEMNIFLENELNDGKSIHESLYNVTKKWLTTASPVIFNGDGYSSEWLEEAAKRGLPNLKSTADALKDLSKFENYKFLLETGVFNKVELETRQNVMLERYITQRVIEFDTLSTLVYQYVIPSVVEYKKELTSLLVSQKTIDVISKTELEILNTINAKLDQLSAKTISLNSKIKDIGEDYCDADIIANELMPLSQEIAALSNALEEIIPNSYWPLPTYLEMLFIK